MSFYSGQIVKLTPTGCQQLHKEPYETHVGFAEPLDLTLASVPAILAVVQKFLQDGVTAAQIGEKVATWLSPGAVPALNSLIDVLTEAETLLSKA